MFCFLLISKKLHLLRGKYLAVVLPVSFNFPTPSFRPSGPCMQRARPAAHYPLFIRPTCPSLPPPSFGLLGHLLRNDSQPVLAHFGYHSCHASQQRQHLAAASLLLGHLPLATLCFGGLDIIGSSRYYPWAAQLGGTRKNALGMALIYGKSATRVPTVAISSFPVVVILYSLRWYAHSALLAYFIREPGFSA